MHYGLRHNFFWILVNRAGTLLAGLLAAALLNRALGASGRGFLAEMQTWIGLFSVLLGISLDTAIYHYANRERYPIGDGVRFGTTLVLSLVAGVAASAGMAMFIWLRPEQVSEQADAHAALMGILLILSMMASNVMVFAQAAGLSKASAFGGLSNGLVYLLLIGHFFLADRIDLGIALGAASAAQGTAFAVTAALCFRSIEGPIEFDFGAAKGMLFAGLKQHVATISTFVYTKINQLIVYKYAGASEAGLYAAALNLAFATQIVFGSFQSALYTRVANAGDDYDITIRSLRLIFYGGLLFVGVAMLFAGPIMMLYGGADFTHSVNLFRVLVLAFWLLSLSSLVSPLYVKAGAFWFASWSAVVLGSISIAFNFVFVPQFKASGAAAATVVTTASGFAMCLGFLYYLSKKSPLTIFKPDFSADLFLLRSPLQKILEKK
ncbi:MAG: polysaccharide biosynthesis C-terminal domain-containing protein [Magnetospirillum sp.]|nr:polysaccharide biosynthesis C-terminal domain-containing protein [Magnetospirillum sp.]